MPESNDEKFKLANARKGLAALRRRISADVFGIVRLRIVLLYLAMGCVVIGIAQYFLYGHILAIIEASLGAVQAALQNNIVINRIEVTRIVFSAIWAEVQKINIITVLWILIPLFLLAYLFAGITLEPIGRILDRQRRFASHVSHELRTPLSVMKTNSEAAFLGAAPPTRAELLDILQNTLEEVDRMTETIEFFFNSSAREERENVEFQKIDLVALAAKTAKFMEKKAAEREIALVCAANDPVYVSGNAILLGGMLINLLKNAIAYTPAGGSILVSVGVGKYRREVLSVKDTGIGIPPKDVPNIFEAFYRGANAVSQQTKRRGTGIGLTIVKEIADVHKAKIFVDTALGQGTTISVVFPKN